MESTRDVCNKARFLPRSDIQKLVAYAVSRLLEQGDRDDALAVLDVAEKKGFLNNQLKDLKEKLEIIPKIAELSKEVVDIVNEIQNNISRDPLLLSGEELDQLKKDVVELRKLIDKARELGISVGDTEFLDIADDLATLLKAVYNGKNTIQQILTYYKRFGNELGSLQNTSDINDFANTLEKVMSKYVNLSASLYSKLDGLKRQIENLQLKTDQASKLRQYYLSMIDALAKIANMMNILSANGSVIPIYIERIENMVRNAYSDPNSSPFGGGESGFVNAVSALLSQGKDMVERLNAISVPGGAPVSLQKAIQGLQELGSSLYRFIRLYLKNLKYSTTYQDYRWNEIWEKAEAQAGVDLGNISKDDVQAYEFKGCQSENSCKFEERKLAGWLVEHGLGDILKFFTTVEDFIRNVEMYNNWVMNYGKNPLLKALGAIGYVGASIIGAVGSLLAPRLLIDNLKVMYNLGKDWATALKDHSLTELKKAGQETYNLFFGSKEAILSLIGMILLGALAGELGGGLKGEAPISKTIASRLMQGDLIGAGVSLIDRIAPVARLRGVARTTIEEGGVRLSEIADSANIIDKVIEKSDALKSIKATRGLPVLRGLLKDAFKNSKNLKELTANIEKAVREAGLEKLEEASREFATTKVKVATDLRNLKYYDKSFTARLRRLIDRVKRKEIPEEELPPSMARSIGKLNEIEAEVRELASGELSGDQLLTLAKSRKLVSEDTLEAMKILSEIKQKYKELGMGKVAESIEGLEKNLENLLLEAERRSELKASLSKLAELKNLGEKQGLWKNVVELGKRKLKPGRGWLKKTTIDVGKELEQLAERIGESTLRMDRLRAALKENLLQLKQTLESGRKAAVHDLANAIASAFREAGMGDVADAIISSITEEAEKGARTGVRASITDAVARALESVADKIASKIGEWRLKMTEVGPSGIREAREAGIPKQLAKVYMAGIQAGESLADMLTRLAERLKRIGVKDPATAEARLVERLTDIIKNKYSEARLENLAFLKGMAKAIEGFQNTPIGTLLSQVAGSLSEVIEAMERPLGKELENMLLRESVAENLEKLMAPEGPIGKLLDKLDAKLNEVSMKMADILEEAPHGRDLVERAKRLMSEEEDPKSIVNELKQYAEAEGVVLPDDYWAALEDYLTLEKTISRIENMTGSLTLDEIQRIIDDISKLDIDAAMASDWSVIKSYLGELYRELDVLKKQLKEASPEIARKIEEAENKIKSIQEAEPISGPISKMKRILELNKDRLALVDSLEKLYNILSEGLGPDKVRKLRSMLDEFERKLAKGEYDETLLQNMLKETLKLRVKTLPKSMLNRLRELKIKIGEKMARLKGGKEAAYLEKAFNRLADTISKMEENMIVEEPGWVGLDRIIGVDKVKYMRVPEELADRVADILNKPEREFKFKTREGYEVTVKREFKVDPSGATQVTYTIEFPGGRKIWVGEANKIVEDGKVATYRILGYDPPVAKAVEAYEEAKAGLRNMDDLAREGEAIVDILSDIDEFLGKIDPDYDIIRRITVKASDGIHGLGDLLKTASGQLLKSLSVASLGEKPSISLTKPVTERIEGALAQSVFPELKKAITKLVEDKVPYDNLSPREKVVLSLTDPIVERLSYLYNLAKGNELGLDEIAYSTALPSDVELELVSPSMPASPGKPYIAIPEPDSNWIDKWLNSEYIVALTLPDGSNIYLPAVTIGDKLVVMIPPVDISLPPEIESELLPLLLLKPSGVSTPTPKAPTSPPLRPVGPLPTTGGTASAGAPPPIIPRIDFNTLARLSPGSMQRERLTI